MAARTLQILVVGPESDLGAEVEAALDALRELRFQLRQASSFGGALELARSRAPDLILVELGGDARALARFAQELRGLAPDVALLGVKPPAIDEDDPKWSAVLLEALRGRFEDVLPRPVPSDALGALARRLRSSGSAPLGRLVVFHSTKGGVGKSTLSISTAAALASRHPDQVLLVDASLQLGVCAPALDLRPDATLADAAREAERLDETMLRQLAPRHACGLRVLAAPRGPAEAMQVGEDEFTQVLAVAVRGFRFVVVDTLPLLDGLMLTALDRAERVYVVTQGTVPDVMGAAELLPVLTKLGIGPERRRVLLNRNTGRFAGALALGEVERRLGETVDLELPYERRVLTALNLGVPYVLAARRWSRWRRAIETLATDVDSLAAPREEAP